MVIPVASAGSPRRPRGGGPQHRNSRPFSATPGTSRCAGRRVPGIRLRDPGEPLPASGACIFETNLDRRAEGVRQAAPTDRPRRAGGDRRAVFTGEADPACGRGAPDRDRARRGGAVDRNRRVEPAPAVRRTHDDETRPDPLQLRPRRRRRRGSCRRPRRPSLEMAETVSTGSVPGVNRETGRPRSERSHDE